MTNADRKHIAMGRTWPTSWDERRDEYVRRGESYRGLAYRDADVKALGLFRGTDTAGNVIFEARRISRDLAFVVDVDAAAIASTLSLDLTDNAIDRLPQPPADASDEERIALRRLSVIAEVERGMAVWRRSGLPDNGERFARVLCSRGDLHLEIIPAVGGTRIGMHAPERCEVYYDQHGIDLDVVVIRFSYTDPPTPDGEHGREHTYRRVLTRAGATTKIDDGPEVFVPHSLGRVAFVHIPFRSDGEPDFSMHATYGYDDIVAVLDSTITMLQVIGSRAAVPVLTVINALLADDDDASKIGRVLNLISRGGDTVDVKYLEATLQGLQALVQLVDDTRTAMKESLPEFLFVESGANASGTALSYRAGAFKQKIEPVKARFARGLGLATSIAVTLDRGAVWDPSVADLFEVRSGPALPEDRTALVALITAAMDAGLLRKIDGIRQAQGAGVAPAEPGAEEYAEDIARENAERKADDLDTARALGIAPDDATDPTAVVAPADAAVQETAFNGAQMQAAAEIVVQVADGKLPRDSAQAMLALFLQVDPDVADEMLGSVGGSFTPTAAV